MALGRDWVHACSGGMRGLRALTLLAALTVSLFAAPSAFAESATDPYIVVLKDDVAHPGNVAHRHEENRGADLGHIYGTAIKGYSAELTDAEVKAVRQDPNVDYVEKDSVYHTMAQSVPTGLKRIGGLGNSSLDIDEVDDVQVNADVAVIDTGVNFHPDLRVVARANCNIAGSGCVENSGDDLFNHGTHVAGIIGALDNSFGVVGVAPGARIWSVRISNSGGDHTGADAIAGIEWVLERAQQIEVANMSWGCTGVEAECSNHGTAMREAVQAMIDAGIVSVASAGNWNVDVDGGTKMTFSGPETYGPTRPANIPDVITVSNLADYDGIPGSSSSPTCTYANWSLLKQQGGGSYVDIDDSLSNSSSWGAAVDIAAPGTCIQSTYSNGGYGSMSGTSMAAPHVAGAAAILAAKQNPNSRANVLAIRDTLRAQGSYDWTDTHHVVNQSQTEWEWVPDGFFEPRLNVSNASVFKNPHPGNLTAVGVTSNTGSALQLFARTAAGGIAAKDYNPFETETITPGWQPWGDGLSLPKNGSGATVSIVGTPAVISRSPATRDIFVRGSDNQIYFRHWDSNLGAWTTWFQIPSPNNTSINGSPAAVANPGIEGALTLVVRAANGQVYLKNYDPAYDWSGWLALGTPPGGATSSPTVTIHNWSVHHVTVRGGNNAIWDRSWSAATGWSSWGSLGGVGTSAPAIVTTESQKDMWLVVRGTDNGMWYRRFLGDFFGWMPWKPLGGVWISDPALAVRDSSGVDVFAVGTDGKAQHRRFVSGGWTNWMRVDDDCPPGHCTWTAGE